MSDKNIHEGDQVQWNYGGGHPSGTVAEIATAGKLEIESKGKQIHRNASPSNPAVHVAREGNDVVKRMSELTKTGGDDNGGGEEEGGEEGKEEEGEDKTKEGKPAEVGEKRERHDEKAAEEKGDGDETKNDGEGNGGAAEPSEAEKDGGKEVKKAKIDEGDLVHTAKKVPARQAKTAAKAKTKKQAESGDTTDAPIKKKPVGRPRKNTASKEAEPEKGEEDKVEKMLEGEKMDNVGTARAVN